VGDEQDSDFESSPDVEQEIFEIGPRLSVHGCKRFIHQQNRGFVRDRSSYRHPLLHPARQLPRIVSLELSETHRIDRFASESIDFRA